LEDNNIPIDYIAGTSMGAIVGSLYACGYTPAEMMAIINSESFADWSTGTIDKKLTYYFLQDDPLPTMINLNLGDSDSTLLSSVLPSSLINPLPMNFAFMELYAPYTAQCRGNFDRLFVPFRCVSSDMTNKRRVVSSSGSLSDAVRASMSFPLVFKPIERDGALLYDGGIYDNFPVDVMRDSFAPQIMIGVDVSSTDTSSDSPNMMSQLETMIIQHSDYSLPADQGIKLRIHLEEFGLLDFPKAAQIYRIGYDHAMAMIDSIKGRIHARIPAEARSLRRNVFKSQTPYLRFDSVHTSGGSEAVNNYVTSLFTRNRPDTISLDRARDAYYRAITPGKFRNLEPTALYSDS
ncbi:MAG: patatin-like phospholipase family protein, partial [Paramuribaculum sp.]|nr:patatin-like phospholipase family protein [Paramuribaculum sp.]